MNLTKTNYYKSYQNTTSVQRLISYSHIGTTLFLGRRRLDQTPTYIHRHVFPGVIWWL